MVSKTVTTTRTTTTDSNGNSTEVVKTTSCGPVCKTVKVAVGVAAVVVILSALTSKS